MTIFTGTRVYQIVATNYFYIWIGKKRKSVARFLAQIARHFRTIDTDCNWTNSDISKLIQIILNAP
jgi:hypothetical protein